MHISFAKLAQFQSKALIFSFSRRRAQDDMFTTSSMSLFSLEILKKKGARRAENVLKVSFFFLIN